MSKTTHCPFLCKNLKEIIGYYRIAKECLTLCKQRTQNIDAKEFKDLTDLSENYLNGILYYIKGIQFAYVGHAVIPKQGTNACAKFLVKAVEFLDQSIQYLSNFKSLKNMCNNAKALKETYSLLSNVYSVKFLTLPTEMDKLGFAINNAADESKDIDECIISMTYFERAKVLLYYFRDY